MNVRTYPEKAIPEEMEYRAMEAVFYLDTKEAANYPGPVKDIAGEYYVKKKSIFVVLGVLLLILAPLILFSGVAYTLARNLAQKALESPALLEEDKNIQQQKLLRAQAILDEMKKQIPKLGSVSDFKPPVEIIYMAEEPIRPSSPNLVLNVLFSTVMGGISGLLGIVFLLRGLFSKRSNDA